MSRRHGKHEKVFLSAQPDRDNRRQHKGPRLDNVDELTARVFHSFGRMMHANRLLMARMSAQNRRHHGEIVALALLGKREGLSQKEFGQILHLSAPRVSVLVDSLEKSGLVERRADENDRRLTRLYVTAEGRQQEKAQRDLLGDYVNQTIGALSESDRRELERLLGELADKTMALIREEPLDRGESEGGLDH